MGKEEQQSKWHAWKVNFTIWRNIMQNPLENNEWEGQLDMF